MEETLLTRTNSLKESDQIREILGENHLSYRTKKIGLDEQEGVIDFNRAVQQIHKTDFYVDKEYLKMAKELILQVEKNSGQSLYLKAYSFRSILFALIWLGGLSSIFALYLGIKGFQTEKKWVALLGIFLSLGGIWVTLYFFILPRLGI